MVVVMVEVITIMVAMEEAGIIITTMMMTGPPGTFLRSLLQVAIRTVTPATTNGHSFIGISGHPTVSYN